MSGFWRPSAIEDDEKVERWSAINHQFITLILHVWIDEIILVFRGFLVFIGVGIG